MSTWQEFDQSMQDADATEGGGAVSITYIIVTRNPSNKKLVTLQDEDDHPLEFSSEEEAMECAKGFAICRAWGAEIVPLTGMDII